MIYPRSGGEEAQPGELEKRIKRLAAHVGLAYEESDTGTMRLIDADSEVFAQAGPEGWFLDVDAILAAPVLLEPTITQILIDVQELFDDRPR